MHGASLSPGLVLRRGDKAGGLCNGNTRVKKAFLSVACKDYVYIIYKYIHIYIYNMYISQGDYTRYSLASACPGDVQGRLSACLQEVVLFGIGV